MNTEEIGRLIVARRKEKNLLQRDLAERSKVGLKSISTIENGRYCFLGTLEAVCHALDLEIKIEAK